MTRLLGTLVLLAVLIAAVGFYRGWFHADTTNGTNQSTLDVTVDKDKIHQDEVQLQNKAGDVDQDVKNKLAPSPATQP